MGFAATVDFKPKRVAPSATSFEMTLIKLEIPGLAPAQKAQMASQFAPFVGLKGSFDVSSRGDLGDISIGGEERFGPGSGAEVVFQAVQQVFEVLMAPLPSAPIGVGAKWERVTDRAENKSAPVHARHVYTLEQANADGATIKAQTAIVIEKRALAERGLPPGTTEELKGEGAYTYVVRFDRIASNVRGQTAITRRIEVTDPATGAKRAVSEVIKVTNTVESVGGAKSATP